MKSNIIIPAALKPLTKQSRWVVWRWMNKDGRRTKPPFQGRRPGQHASSTDSATWCDLDTALRAYRNGKADGIGFTLGEGTDAAALDVDHCRNQKTGALHPWAERLVSRCGSYAEVTPSGTGIRIIGVAAGAAPVHRKLPVADGVSVEIYIGCERYITVSGEQLNGSKKLADIGGVADELLAELDRKPNGSKPQDSKHDLDDLIKNGCGKAFNGDRSRAVWFVIHALLQQERTDDEIVGVLLDRSNRISEHIYDQTQPEDYARRQVQQAKEQHAQLLPPPSMPMAVARVFVARRHTEDDQLTLRYWRGAWWGWCRSHWRELEPREVRSELYAFAENGLYRNTLGDFSAWAPNRRKIGDLLEALGAICLLPDDVNQPAWLDNRKAGAVVATRNGLLDIETRTLIPHTPQFFNTTSVPFAYDPDAPEPTRWLEFLDELWPTDDAAIDALQEWFGYVISGRTDLHKILLMVGPTRGGKGAIARILGALVGTRNVAGPTLSSLSTDFGLSPLIGKSLAVVADMRASRDTNIIIERLLSISGEDTLTINRKYRDQWTGKLGVRFHIISNELPQLGDASAAIIGRFVTLLTSRSWLGKEDRQLESTLMGELAGILNWSLDGLERLVVTNNNCFTYVAAAAEAIDVMRDLASPVAAFVRDECEIGLRESVEVDALYAAYRVWCSDNGHPIATKQTVGRNLRAALPRVRIKRPHEESTRVRVYQGIALKKDR
jgi:putative DNA primase/helicase